ncbi:SDR family NAD(P)-dependent oxidoreductase [Candidatus Nucleicultrix amoebiphila]|jgi:NAD(P)-dependent dehydrogenase (short-subunit alcohol dehydrogenase family)|uniref:Oxidoreductase n=1 Tax=Candidatus Nucleicultrix amoebiphila FS5 TaxID=1414854 RepID=A0A1W6N4H1_9PROT|nr:SDR family NAD(P)-dependent oxidoreductase [Candidatus Nucleicultrix amoebiphila]ARN84753.1 hypothetical protein GQ61_04970 [Candidatus Nucleicultrix amoebiphila FS5]
MGRLKGRKIIITGATGGLGQSVAKKFDAEGAELILIGRKTKSLEDLDDCLSKNALLIPLDLKNTEGIYEMAASIGKRFGYIDGLLGLAATLGSLTPLTHLTPALWQQVLQTNLHANWHLLRALEPLLLKSTGGRICFATDLPEETAYWGAYATSKSGLNTMIKAYSKEMEHSKIKVNLINPGPLRTNLRAQAFPGEDPSKIASPDTVTDMFVEAMAS